MNKKQMQDELYRMAQLKKKLEAEYIHTTFLDARRRRELDTALDIIQGISFGLRAAMNGTTVYTDFATKLL